MNETTNTHNMKKAIKKGIVSYWTEKINGQIIETTFKCKPCGEITKTEETMLKHLDTKHPNGKIQKFHDTA